MVPDAQDGAWLLVFVGGALLVGFVAHVVGRRAHVPRVTLLLLIGAFAGPAGLDLVPPHVEYWFPTIAHVSLSLIAFTLGKHFTYDRLRRIGRLVMVASIVQSLMTAAIVFVAVILVGGDPVLALLLAAVAPATAPAATVDVVREVDASGPVTETTLEVVALDDAWAITLFTALAALAAWLTGNGAGVELIAAGAYELLGGIVFGGLLGLPMAWITGRLRPGQLTLIESLGFVLLAGGLASLAGVSYLVVCMTLGVVVANVATHHDDAFHAVEGALDPFLVIFFLLAGFELDIRALAGVSALSVAYVLGRVTGKYFGGVFGARLGGATPVVRRYLGWTLLPQAGVALGLGLLIANRFPAEGARILQLLIVTTVFFELVGPVATRVALVRAGEVPN